MYKNKQITIYKMMALLLSVSILLTTVLGGTFAHLITKTPSLINTFLSGLDPTGDLVISKEVTHPFGNGYNIPDGLSFDFSISLGESYAGKTVDTSLGDITADENGVITLSVVAGKAVRICDLVGGTAVTVTEGFATGFTPYGGAEKTITIQRGTENRIEYVNDYAPSPVSSVNLTVSGTKLLEGRDWQEGDSFTFQLDYKLAGEETWEKAGETSVSYELIEVTDPETQEVHYEPKSDFDKFSFTDLVQSITYDTAGEYSFRVSEVDGTIGGITYDKVVSYFDVTVGDADMDGYLEIQDVKGYHNAVAFYDESNGDYHVDVTVNNKYAPEGTATATVNINKRVDSYSGEEKTAAGYSFELYDESGNLVATSCETSAAGETSIELILEAKDAGETFHYTLKETHGGETINGMVYADAAYPISVSVVDELDGTISAYVYGTDEHRTELIEIETPESAEQESGATEETVSNESNSEQMESETEENELTVSDDSEGEFEKEESEAAESETTESEIVVVATDSNAVREEVTENESIVMTASAPETKEVVVIPDGATDDYKVSFVNVYDPDDTSASFVGIKKLIGRTLKEGEFAFELYATGENFTVNEDTEPIQTVTHDAEGNFGFTTIEYDEVGIYRYVVKEDASGNLGGITYDESVFRVTVTVTDENGVLNATVKITDELGADAELIFKNKYEAAPTSIIFSGRKTLTGMDLSADMFKFLLYKADENYNVLGAATAKAYNDDDGNFKFESIEFAETGTFHYVVKEDSSAKVEGMTYDDTIYGIEVDVWDDGAGNLKADVTITKVGGSVVDEILFENSYTKLVEPDEPDKPTEPEVPDKPEDEPDEPQDTEEPEVSGEKDNVQSGGTETGDVHQVECMVVLLVVSGAVAVMVWKKRFRI